MNNHLFGYSSQQRFSYSAIRPCTYSTHLALGFLGWWANWLCGYVVKIVVEKNWKSVKYAEICWKIRPKIVRNRHKIGRATCNARRCTCKMRGATPKRAQVGFRRRRANCWCTILTIILPQMVAPRRILAPPWGPKMALKSHFWGQVCPLTLKKWILGTILKKSWNLMKNHCEIYLKIIVFLM